jgi:hypothetical protein
MRIRNDNRIGRSMRRMREGVLDVNGALGVEMARAINGKAGVEFTGVIQWATTSG